MFHGLIFPIIDIIGNKIIGRTTPDMKHVPYPFFDGINQLANPVMDARQALVIHESIAADELYEDLIHSFGFLMSYNGSTATFNSYRREIERLLQWTYYVRQTSLSHLGRQDMEEFIHFCQAPPGHWIGHKQVARFKKQQGIRKPNPDWRPFVVASGKRVEEFELSRKSIQALFAVLSTYFNYLLQDGHLETNPIALVRQRSRFVQKHAYMAPVRRISNLQWDYILETVEQLAQQHPQEHERSLFVIRCLFGMYLRISELVADERSIPVMEDFQVDADGHWWLRVVGKGNKARMVTVSDDMLAALRRYRLFLGLSPLPFSGDRTPLVSKLKGRGPVTSTRQIRYLVQFCFDQAYQRMVSEGLSDDAQELKVATVHWLRHTGISEDVQFRPKEHVKEDAGHASMATTDRYINTEMRERHASARHKKLKPDY